jgi:hypothetical protein
VVLGTHFPIPVCLDVAVFECKERFDLYVVKAICNNNINSSFFALFSVLQAPLSHSLPIDFFL